MQALCAESVHIEPRDFISIKRLGKKPKDKTKSRPLQLRFKNRDTRTKILKDYRNLEIKIEEQNFPAFFSMDRNKLQEKKLFNLREQKREKADKGETDWTVFGYKLMKKGAIPSTKKTFASLF